MIPLALLAVAAVSAQCSTPSIGAAVNDISHFIRRERNIPEYIGGAFVRSVIPKGPAARAGLHPGDVIQAIDRDLLQNACDASAAIAKRGCAGMKLTIRRGGETMSIGVRAVDASTLPARRLDDQRACEQGDGEACTSLAKAHDEDLVLMRQACDLGDPEGCYVAGLKVGDDREKVAFYEQACDGGYSQACTNLGWMYQNAKAVNKDSAAAARLYKRGCDGNACYLPNNLGCVNLGRMFRDGDGVEEHQTVATRLFRNVCSRSPLSDEDAANIARACSLAGTAYLSGAGVPKDVLQALPLLEKSCAASDTLGCFNLGIVYENGAGVTADKGRAIGYYQRACDHGDGEACQRAAALSK
jgi:TPR repeat protein